MAEKIKVAHRYVAVHAYGVGGSIGVGIICFSVEDTEKMAADIEQFLDERTEAVENEEAEWDRRYPAGVASKPS